MDIGLAQITRTEVSEHKQEQIKEAMKVFQSKKQVVSKNLVPVTSKKVKKIFKVERVRKLAALNEE